MARFPDPTQSQRRVSNAQAPVGSVRNAGAVGNALGDVANTIGREAEESRQRRQNYEYNNARAKFMTSKVQIDNSFRDDPDYETFDDRYMEGVNASLNEVAMTISDPEMRDAFIAEQGFRIAQGRERISDLARSKEVDFRQSEIIENLAGLKGMVIEGGDTETVSTAQALVDAAVENGYIDRVAGTNMMSAWKEQSAVAWLESIEPEKRLEALNSPMAENLPVESRAGLKREAESELMKYTASGMVDGWVANDTDRATRLVEINKIKDPDLRDEVMRQSDNQMNQAAKAELETQTEIYDAIFPAIRAGEVTVDQMNKDQLNSLTPAMINNLYAAEANAAKTTAVRSNRDVLSQLQFLETMQDYGAMRKLLMERGAELSDSDYEQYSKIGIEGDAPIDYQSLKAAKSLLTNKMTVATGDKPSDVEYSQLHEALSDWHRRYWNESEQKKLPTDKEIEDKIDQLLMTTSVPDAGFAYFDMDKPLYQLNASEIEDVIDQIMATGDQKRINDVVAIIGEDADPIDFIEAYEYAARRGN